MKVAMLAGVGLEMTFIISIDIIINIIATDILDRTANSRIVNYFTQI